MAGGSLYVLGCIESVFPDLLLLLLSLRKSFGIRGGIFSEGIDLLGKFLSFCDLSKFAQHDPSEDECRRLHAIAVQLVNETAPPSPGAAPPRLVPPQLN